MLRTHWVLVVMDQYTRRIIGFGVHAGTVDGVALCRMFNRAIRGQRRMPNFLSCDNDSLYRFHQWQANLRILDVTEIKSVPYVPLSHPFRGEANRHRSTGVFGSHFVLDCRGSRKQAARFQDLLQQPSHPYLNGRANAESACITTNRKSPLVSRATSLSILISDTSGRVIFRTLSIAPASGQPWKDFQLNHLVLAFLVAERFADPIVSLQPYQFARDTFLHE